MEREKEIKYVTRLALRPFRYHPYQIREDEEMVNLVNSIRENGVIETLIVKKRDSKQYEILSWHRRFKACQILGFSEIPIIVKDIYIIEKYINHRERTNNHKLELGKEHGLSFLIHYDKNKDDLLDYIQELEIYQDKPRKLLFNIHIYVKVDSHLEEYEFVEIEEIRVCDKIFE